MAKAVKLVPIVKLSSGSKASLPCRNISATLEVPFWDMWCWSARLFRCMSVRGLPSVGICGCPDPGCTGRSGMGRSSVSLGGVGSRRTGTALSG